MQQQISGRVTPNDPRDVYFLVGFLEYGQALKRFDHLLSELSPGELEAVEQIVLADNRLALETNLSRRQEVAAGPLSEPGGPGESFRRHSLAWVMALARVETGAMLAAFTETPHPFRMVQPSEYEAAAYRELLLDALRTHFLSLPADTQWQQLASLEDQPLLAQQRRLTLASRFAEAVLDAGLDGDKLPALQSMVARLQTLKALVERQILDRLRTRQGFEVGEHRLQGTKQSERTTIAPDR